MSKVTFDGTNPGVWVENQCRELGVSVACVAREARLHRTTILRWKRGDTGPNYDSIRRLESVLTARKERRSRGDQPASIWARHERAKSAGR